MDADNDNGQFVLNNVCPGAYTITETFSPTNLACDGDPTRAVDVTSGNDTVNAGEGSNWVRAGAGNDNITTGAGPDAIEGQAGFDTCSPGAGANTVTGCEVIV